MGHWDLKRCPHPLCIVYFQLLCFIILGVGGGLGVVCACVTIGLNTVVVGACQPTKEYVLPGETRAAHKEKWKTCQMWTDLGQLSAGIFYSRSLLGWKGLLWTSFMNFKNFNLWAFNIKKSTTFGRKKKFYSAQNKKQSPHVQIVVSNDVQRNAKITACISKQF